MKNIPSALFLITLFSIGCMTSKPVVTSTPVVEEAQKPPVNFSEQSTWLLGYINREQLSREPHSSWFIKGYDEYSPNPEVLTKLSQIPKEGITVKIVLGTWCPDSRREVPRFMNIIDQWKFPATALTFIGVDNAKLSPVGEYEMLDIQRVPTFIIYKNNVEAGRIIENPVTSLEQDMVNILAGNE